MTYSGMAKNGKTARSSRSGSYKVAGRLPDGVKVLEPKTKPTHFTSRELSKTIAAIRDAKTGRFANSDDRPAKKG